MFTGQRQEGAAVAESEKEEPVRLEENEESPGSQMKEVKSPGGGGSDQIH